MLWSIYETIGVAGIIIAGALAFIGFYFTRSSKSLPKTLGQLKSEIQWQIHGMLGLIEDFLLRSRNQIELYSQPGRLAVITGGNRGIGLRVVEKLLRCDMTVVMGVRNPKEAQDNLEQIIDVKQMKGKVYYETLDTGRMESVRKFATYLQNKFTKIDILVNNAGVMAAPFEITEDGFESQLAINYLGHFLLTHLLLPQLKAAGTANRNSRIVNVSSCIHLVGSINFDDIHGLKYYYPPDAYNQSKLAQVLFTRHLQIKLNQDDAHVQIHAVHPGLVDTDLFVHSSTTYIPWVKRALFKNPEEGSRTVTYAAISPKIEGKGGSYLSNCTIVKMNSLAKDKVFCEKFFNFTCKNILNIEKFGEI